jgi:glycosyltransferase involved in cell wall biosynthesis
LPRPLISFFVQAYNTGPWIAECLDSIFAQRGDYMFEVIVIDDASKDNTAEIVRSFRDPRLRFIAHETNRGSSATANEGYAACTGQYLLRIDSDDRLRPEFLERAVPLLEQNPRVGLVYGDIATMDAHGEITCDGNMVRRDDRPLIGDEFLPLLLNNFIPAPTTLVRREALLPLLPIPADYHFLDWYLSTGIAEQWHTAFVPELQADYRIHTTNMHRTMIRDLSGERTIFRVLDTLFVNGRRVEEKQGWRRHVYAQNYLKLADNYFGCEMNADARRCYAASVRYAVTFGIRRGVARRFVATFINRSLYTRAKKALRPATASSCI